MNPPFLSLLAGKRCLIVEDEFLIAMDYERILQDAGAQQVLSANSVRRAEELLHRHGPVQLALLDMNLNGESSLALVKSLIADNVPVVVITGLVSGSALPDAMTHIPVLEKPLEELTLLTAIAKVLRPASPTP